LCPDIRKKPFFFEAIDQAKLSWRIYFNDISATLFHRYVRELQNLPKFRAIVDFENDCKNKSLPTFSWIEPRFFEDFGQPANDQHPDHDVSEGERFIKRVYEALRNSPSWEDTLLLITYDEHGGFYDHVPTPVKNVPSPDNLNCTRSSPGFDFRRLGVRVPTIAVSPWINKGTVVHTPNGPTPDSQFDHTSIFATVKKMFGLPAFLTKRDAWAGTFETVVAERSTPRTDCPSALPDPPHLRRLPLDGSHALSHLQEELVQLAAALHGQTTMPELRTEGEGAAFIRDAIRRFLRID